jgi:hypothetical protein
MQADIKVEIFLSAVLIQAVPDLDHRRVSENRIVRRIVVSRTLVSRRLTHYILRYVPRP